MKGSDILSLAVLGVVGYVLYEHFALGQSWQSSVSFIPGGSALAKSVGLTGCYSDIGLGCTDCPPGIFGLHGTDGAPFYGHNAGFGMLAAVEGPFSGYRPISSGVPMRSELSYASRV